MAEFQMVKRAKLERGQSMVEYTLIIVLVVISFALALAATGPALGNVFCNTVYNLVGGDDEIISEYYNPDGGGCSVSVAGSGGIESFPSVEEFWLTVTWVAQHTPPDIPLATNTPAPPTQEPTAGPSPTNTEVVPTNTFTPSKTPTPSPTPEDFEHTMPWSDTANELVYWRLDNDFYMGSADWYGSYYSNKTLSGEPEEQLYNAQIDPAYKGVLSFDWGSGSPIDALGGNDFSVSWRRQIYIADTTTIEFSLPMIDDGVRVWILGGRYGSSADNCSATGVTSGGAETGSWDIYDDAHFGYDPNTDPPEDAPSECLLIDRWRNGNDSIGSVRRTIPVTEPEGELFTIQVDYYEDSGGARIGMNFADGSSFINPDDRRVDSSGAELGGAPDCGWDHRSADLANSLDYAWDEYQNGKLPVGTRCYLELRGSVYIPDGTANPTLSFWDAWDLRGGTSAWIEVADYDPDNDGNFNRADLSWQRINLHQNDTFNYNWTYHSIDLSPYLGASRKVTFRFGIENRSSTAENRWYIDTIQVDTVTRDTLYTAQLWELDDAAEAESFITSGHWELTGEKTIGGGGMSWHESPSRSYSRFGEDRDGADVYDDGNVRMHTIEFNGFIDLTDPRGGTDLEDDTGAPLLSFWHQYDLGPRTGLEVQYTTDPYGAGDGANWQPVPDTGVLIPRDSGSGAATDVMEFVEIPLEPIGVDQFRLRLAMIVTDNAGTEGGWWIDNIQLERQGLPKFTNYPFVDQAEDPINLPENWNLGTTWGRVDQGRRPPAGGGVGFAYTDSPQGDFTTDTESTFELRYPFDMFLDTPENPRSPDCTLPGDLCETPDEPPENPALTFWHWRDFGSGGEDFYVEWKRASEDSSEWRVAWAYLNRMRTNGTGNDSETVTQRGWERVFVDMTPIMNELTTNNDGGDKTDDDIVFRFRLSTNNNTTADGVYVDDIRVQDYTEESFRLWAAGESREDPDGNTIVDENGDPVLGSGTVLYDSVENNQKLYSGGWHFGGDWNAIDFEQRVGLLAFHDSPEGQDDAPTFADGSEIDSYTAKTDSFNVLEMETIVDLRGVEASERPIMYFWSRYGVGRSNYARVQISYRDPNVINNPLCRNDLLQCYEKRYGWSEWETVWERNDRTRTYTWQREQVSLDNYAKSGSTPGKEIRIRFVMDALRNNDPWDGWYIDEITIEHYNPRVIPITWAGQDSFFDPARNMNNWVAEGKWGLSPSFYRGEGGGPASLGSSAWNYAFWNMSRSSGGRCQGQEYISCVTNWLDSTPGQQDADDSGLVLEIDNDWGRSGPYLASEDDIVTDFLAGRWELTTGEVGVAVQQGTYTFITASDDGVRMKYDTVPPGNLPSQDPDENPLAGQEWNIINNWTYHGRTVDIGTAVLQPGYRYNFTLEWFEAQGGALIQLTTGSNKFSFTDSPAEGPDINQDVPAEPRSNSSLILDGVFDLTNTTAPFLRYYTYHEFGGYAHVEVSTDGGFTWTQDGMMGSVPNNVWQGYWEGEFFNDKNNPGPAGTGITANVGNLEDLNFYWGNNSPQSGVNNDFSSRWTRDIRTSQNMLITFKTRSDDGARVWVDDNLVLEEWRTGGDVRGSGTFIFEANRTYTITVEHFDSGYGAKLRLDTLSGNFDNPTYGGTYMPDPEDKDRYPWQEKIHDLTEYAGFPAVSLRFRLDRQNEKDQNESNNDFQSGNQDPTDWYESWWIVDITVTDQSAAP